MRHIIWARHIFQLSQYHAPATPWFSLYPHTSPLHREERVGALSADGLAHRLLRHHGLRAIGGGDPLLCEVSRTEGPGGHGEYPCHRASLLRSSDGGDAHRGRGGVYDAGCGLFGQHDSGRGGGGEEYFPSAPLDIVITLSTLVFRSVINAHERFLFLKGMETVQLALQPMLVVLLLMHHPSAFSVALVQTELNLVLSFARGYYCFAGLHVWIRYHYWSHELMVSFRRLVLSVFAVTLIDQVFWKTNQIIFGVISGTAAVAVYSTASIIYMGYIQLSGAISGVYLPHVVAMVAEKAEKLSALFIQIGRWQYYLLALVATGFILFGERFIRLWAGEGFEEAYGITLLIILPFTIDLIQNVGLAILQAENWYDFRAKVYFGTGLSMFLGNGLVMNWFYAKEIHLAIASF